jgi:hypothetical protein
MCDTTITDEPDGLCCTRADEHEPHHGCCFTSTSGVPGAAKEE